MVVDRVETVRGVPTQANETTINTAPGLAKKKQKV